MSADEIIYGVNKMVEKYYLEVVTLKPGAAAFLELLRNNGVKMCIATATDEYLAEAALKRCGVMGYFSKIFTCTSVGCGKDKPVIYRKALKYLGTKKSESVVFEDALYAIKTAKSDGFITTAIYDKYEKCQEEIRALSDYYITDYSETEEFWKFASAI